jgi:hypothetical protein
MKEMSAYPVAWPDMDPLCGNPQEEMESPRQRQKKFAWGGSKTIVQMHSVDDSSDTGDGDIFRSLRDSKTPADVHDSPGAHSKKDSSSGGSGNSNPNQGPLPQPGEANVGNIWERANSIVPPSFRRNMDLLTDFMGEACASPCYSRNMDLDYKSSSTNKSNNPVLGIARMEPPSSSVDLEQGSVHSQETAEESSTF